MRRLALALLLVAPLAAYGQSAGQLLDDQASSLDQRVSALEDRVAALEGAPADAERANLGRAQDLDGAIRDLDGVAQALSLGQTDVASALTSIREVVAANEGSKLETVHAQAAAGALSAAMDAVGRGDLFNARGAVDVAQLELARARDAALAR